MIVRLIVRALGAVVLASVAFAPAASAQQAAPAAPPAVVIPQASPAAVALAKQVLDAKGGLAMFDPLIDNIVNGTKNNFMQIDPTAQRDIDEIAANLRKEFAPKREEFRTDVARIYASQFTEQELKDVYAFYQSPLGKKLIVAEPKAGEMTMQMMEQSASKFVEQVGERFRAELRKKGHTQF